MEDQIQEYFKKEIEHWTRIGEWFDVALAESIAGFRLSEMRHLKDGLLSWSSSRALTKSETKFADRMFAAIIKQEAKLAKEVEAYKRFHELDDEGTVQ